MSSQRVQRWYQCGACVECDKTQGSREFEHLRVVLLAEAGRKDERDERAGEASRRGRPPRFFVPLELLDRELLSALLPREMRSGSNRG